MNIDITFVRSTEFTEESLEKHEQAIRRLAKPGIITGCENVEWVPVEKELTDEEHEFFTKTMNEHADRLFKSMGIPSDMLGKEQ